MGRRSWGWSLSHPPSFDFNNVGVLKSYLYHKKGHTATMEELKQVLRRELKRSYSDLELEEIYLKPLYCQPELFSVEDNVVHLKMDKVPENDEAEAVLEKAGVPLTLKEVKKEVAQRLSTSVRYVV